MIHSRLFCGQPCPVELEGEPKINDQNYLLKITAAQEPDSDLQTPRSSFIMSKLKAVRNGSWKGYCSFIADSAIDTRAVTSTKSISAIKIQITGVIVPKPINKRA
jgi:hypothetical protein